MPHAIPEFRQADLDESIRQMQRYHSRKMVITIAALIGAFVVMFGAVYVGYSSGDLTAPRESHAR